MSLCIAWRWNETVCLATDSRISIDAVHPTDCGIKVLQVPVRVISPIDASTGRFDTIFESVYGLCFAGRFVTAYLVKESISELLFHLQFVGVRENLSFHKICEVVFACFSRVMDQLIDLDADFILAGCCPSDGRSLAVKFFRDQNGDLKWSEILSKRPFSYEAIGAGADGFCVLFDVLRKTEEKVHFAAFDAMDRILSRNTIPSVGGAVQYGHVEFGREFRLFGVFDYSLSENEVQIHQTLRGMNLKELYEGKDSLDLHVHYDFVDPFQAKKKRIYAELGMPLEER